MIKFQSSYPVFILRTSKPLFPFRASRKSIFTIFCFWNFESMYFHMETMKLFWAAERDWFVDEKQLFTCFQQTYERKKSFVLKADAIAVNTPVARKNNETFIIWIMKMFLNTKERSNEIYVMTKILYFGFLT